MRSFGKLGVVCIVACLVFGLRAASVAADDDDEEDAINVPIPVGKDAMGLRIPLYDQNGKLTMTLDVQRAQKTDEFSMQMEGAVVQTYAESEKPDLRIELPLSEVNLRTRVVSSKSPVTIERKDFRLTGDAMEFYLKSKKGRVMRNVKMLIYNRDNLSHEKSAE